MSSICLHAPDLEVPQRHFICLSDRFDLHAEISPEDVEWARQWLWGYKYAAGVKASTDKLYAWRSMSSGGRANRVQRAVFLHVEICRRAHGEPPSDKHTMADHKNGDSLDCRRGNLHWATPSMNAKNRFGILARELQDAALV